VCQFCFAQGGAIKGRVIDKETNEKLPFVKVTLADQKIERSTDFDGVFNIDSLPKGIYQISISYPGYNGGDITSIINSQDTVIELLIELPFPCPQGHGSICPICKKEDQVIPIEYGIPRKRLVRKAKRGKVKLGGCVIKDCDPDWYCKRDDKEFR
jgi:hypothetical protein